MSAGYAESLSKRLRGAVLLQGDQDESDAELLTEYLRTRRDEAFEKIVRRHGAMVLGVCVRVLGNRHDAEDAFQAAFLVLALKAATIMPRERLSDWLHGVALRTALKARTARVRWQSRARNATAQRPEAALPESDWCDLKPLLDQELAALPENYRRAIVLCDLEGEDRKSAARALGWKEGTLSGRLARGRRMLAKRLRRRGVALTAVGLGAAAAPRTFAEQVPATLLSSTVEASSLAAAGNLTAVSAPVAALTREVIRSMFIKKLKKISLVVVVAILGMGAPIGLSQTPSDAPQPPAGNAEKPAEAKNSPPSIDISRLNGRLIVHRGDDLAYFDPRRKQIDQQNRLTPTPEADRRNYQTLTARLSPDMRFLAFGQAEDGHPPSKIQIRDTRNGGESRIVVNMPGTELSGWCWSPDGKKLSFLAWEEGDHAYRSHVVDIASGQIEKADLPDLKGDGPVGYGAVIEGWSPDGLWLVHARGHFFLVNPETKQARRITSKVTGFFADTCRFSPDGKKVLFVGSQKEGSWNLSVVDLLLGNLTIVANLDRRWDFAPCWAPDSRHIACTSIEADEHQKPSGPPRLEIYDAGGKEQSVVLAKGLAAMFTVTDWR